MHISRTGAIAFEFIGLSGPAAWLIFVGFGLNCAWPILHPWLTDAYPEATITGVTMSRDLRIAKVYFAAHGGKDDEQDLTAGFESAKGYIKRRLAAELGLRYMPELRFFYDSSFDRGEKIERIIHDLNQDDGTDHSAIG